MQLAIDIYYGNEKAKAVGVLFNWNDESPSSVIVEWIENVAPYVSGEFYKRELPCILQVIKKVDLATVEAIIIDGYVYIDNEKKYGLGGYLWEALYGKIPIIGVAKTSFFRNKETVTGIVRGDSKNPLFVSSIGIDLAIAADCVKNMKGDFRMPSLLKRLDQITKA